MRLYSWAMTSSDTPQRARTRAQMSPVPSESGGVSVRVEEGVRCRRCHGEAVLDSGEAPGGGQADG